MSIIASLQQYLMEFDGMEMQNPIMTDFTSENPTSYAVSPSGNNRLVTDILGNKTYVNNYIFLAKESTKDEADRKDNYDFLDAFFDWVEERDSNDIYPEIPGYTVDEISVSNVMLMDVDEGGAGIYQIQIQLVIRREKREQN